MTEASTDPQPDAAGAERPRRKISIGIKRKPRPADEDAAAVEAPAEPDDQGEDAATADEPEQARRRIGIRRKPRPEADDADPEIDEDGPAATVGRLRRERRALMDRRQQDVYDLGGLAFELYRRDLLVVDILREKAGLVAQLDARVREIDTQLDELEHLRRSRKGRGAEADQDRDAGACASCQAPFREGAAYCWRCGAHLTEEEGLADQDTGAIPRVAETP